MGQREPPRARGCCTGSALGCVGSGGSVCFALVVARTTQRRERWFPVRTALDPRLPIVNSETCVAERILLLMRLDMLLSVVVLQRFIALGRCCLRYSLPNTIGTTLRRCSTLTLTSWLLPMATCGIAANNPDLGHAYDRLDEESHAVGCRERDKQREGRGCQEVEGSGVHSFRLKELKISESSALFGLGSY